MVRRQLCPFRSSLLFDAVGAAKRWQESGEKREGVDGSHVEAEE